MKIKIVLADNHTILRQGLKSLLEKDEKITVIAEAENGAEAVEIIKITRPHVVIMDLMMPRLNGIEATKQIKAMDDSIKIICLSMYSEKKFVFEMLKAGASGYLIKDSAFEELVLAIRAVIQNNSYISPQVADYLIEYVKSHETALEKMEDKVLTTREKEVLQLLSEGKTSKEIAAVLHISCKTVECHKKHIKEKLHTDNIASLTKYAIREGIVSLYQ